MPHEYSLKQVKKYITGDRRVLECPECGNYVNGNKEETSDWIPDREHIKKPNRKPVCPDCGNDSLNSGVFVAPPTGEQRSESASEEQSNTQTKSQDRTELKSLFGWAIVAGGGTVGLIYVVFPVFRAYLIAATVAIMIPVAIHDYFTDGENRFTLSTTPRRLRSRKPVENDMAAAYYVTGIILFSIVLDITFSQVFMLFR